MTNRTQKILLIEDDPAVAESLRDALRQEGYQVLWTAYGVEGIRQIIYLLALGAVGNVLRIVAGTDYPRCRYNAVEAVDDSAGNVAS